MTAVLTAPWDTIALTGPAPKCGISVIRPRGAPSVVASGKVVSSTNGHRLRLLFAAPFLATGAGLLAYILAGVSLPLGVAFVGVWTLVVATGVWRRSDVLVRAHIRRRVAIGLIAGLLATIAYDLSRALLVEYANFAFRPFDTFTLFGQALLGTGDRGLWVVAAGLSFHLANGLGFAVAYALCLGERGVRAGIAWAFVLELAMVTVYPGWLGLKALDEFMQVSVLGHLAYGSVLGFVTQHMVRRPEGR